MPQIHGHCDDRFSGVRTAFEANIRDRDELGAAVTVLVDGGTCGRPLGRLGRRGPYPLLGAGALVNVWSTSKGPTALCVRNPGRSGLLDRDAPVAGYWPEFAAAGKDRGGVRGVVTRRGGGGAAPPPPPPTPPAGPGGRTPEGWWGRRNPPPPPPPPGA
ncbi:serine hydrolase, partial [Streptomyces sp. NPDC056352]|uniref:serine hydrolase n=1 Tax=Streptomyces sp. NPDC056352 TaxID=3345791 RepID=UPI0035E0C64F